MKTGRCIWRPQLDRRTSSSFWSPRVALIWPPQGQAGALVCRMQPRLAPRALCVRVGGGAGARSCCDSVYCSVPDLNHSAFANCT